MDLELRPRDYDPKPFPREVQVHLTLHQADKLDGVYGGRPPDLRGRRNCDLHTDHREGGEGEGGRGDVLN